MNILLTGASGMLGRYLLKRFEDAGHDVTTLQRNMAHILCDLSEDIPDLDSKSFDLVVHAAGTTHEADALQLNLEGTKHLLKALDDDPPKEFVFLSSWEVYSPDAGEDVAEGHQLWASSKVGQSKALAEDLLSKWCADKNVRLTILRPARMMGKGVKGEMSRLFNDVIRGRYIHVRGNDARLSLVCASDVADAIDRLHSVGGVYNVSDGVGATWIELAEAMSANSGAMKRQTFLPEKWAALAWRVMPWLPAVKASLSPETLSRRSKTMTLSSSALKNALPDWVPFKTIDVISRQDDQYPYEDC